MARQRAVLFGTVAALLLAIVVLIVLSARQRARDDARNLDAILVFADPAGCRPGEPLARILQDMYQIAPGPEPAPGGPALWPPRELRAGPPIAVPGFAGPLRPRLKRYRSDEIIYDHYAVLDLRGRWHGLKVVALNSDPNEFRIHFDEPPERVRTVLSRAGFRMPPAGTWRPDPVQHVGRGETGDTVILCMQPIRSPA